MKYFNKDGKYNWVDENNTFVGYDSYRGWCEAYGWIVNPTILSTDEIYDVDGAESIEPDTELEDYNFDTSFFQRSDPDKNFDEGLAIFRLLHKSDGEDLYLHLYNIHNRSWLGNKDVSKL